jgi:RES domain-containing protein
VRAWRLVTEHRASTAFDGEGSYRFGNRWNHPGVRVVYIAEHLSLAALEVLVHSQDVDLVAYRAIPIEYDLAWVENLETLPDDWQVDPAPASTKDIGSTWAQQASSLLLRVPSTVVPVEFNLILNIQHPNFGKLEFGEGQEFVFDPRLNR